MLPQKPKKMGRPKLSKGDAKGKTVVVRFSASDLKRVESAARASQKTVSEWIRSTVNRALEA
jgi:hypothetical protein